MADFTFDVLEKCGTISKREGWAKELRVVSYNGNEPKYDIREWNSDDTRMSKGITLTFEELTELYTVIGKVLGG